MNKQIAGSYSEAAIFIIFDVNGFLLIRFGNCGIVNVFNVSSAFSYV